MMDTLKNLQYDRWSTQTIGAGRMFSKKTMQKLDWILWEIRKWKRNRGLDSCCENKLLNYNIKIVPYSMEELNICIIDVKTSNELNITPLEILLEEKNKKRIKMSKKTKQEFVNLINNYYSDKFIKNIYQISNQKIDNDK